MRAKHFAMAAGGIVGLGLIGWGVYAMGPGDFMDWLKQIVNERTPTPIFLALALVLPVIGVPLSLFLVIGGTKFGLGMGLVMLAAMIPGQLAALYWIGNSLSRELVERLLSGTKYDLPRPSKDHYGTYAVSVAVVPGLSYTVKCLALAFMDVPFKIYFFTSWPLHFAMGAPFVLMGSAAHTMNPWLLGGGLAGFFAVLFGVRYAAKRLRQKRSGGD